MMYTVTWHSGVGDYEFEVEADSEHDAIEIVNLRLMGEDEEDEEDE